MLRASATDEDEALRTVRDPTVGGVDGAIVLGDLVTAIVEGDPPAITEARAALASELGPDAVADAVAVVANFEMMTRIADGTGARHDTVDDQVAEATGAEDFDTRR